MKCLDFMRQLKQLKNAMNFLIFIQRVLLHLHLQFQENVHNQGYLTHSNFSLILQATCKIFSSRICNRRLNSCYQVTLRNKFICLGEQRLIMHISQEKFVVVLNVEIIRVEKQQKTQRNLSFNLYLEVEDPRLVKLFLAKLHNVCTKDSSS